MSLFVGCEDARNMKSFEEIDCPRCAAIKGIEVIIKDGVSVGESICDVCGYVIPEGVHLEKYLEQDKIMNL